MISSLMRVTASVYPSNITIVVWFEAGVYEKHPVEHDEKYTTFRRALNVLNVVLGNHVIAFKHVLHYKICFGV